MEDDSAFKYGKEKSCGTIFMQLMFSHVGLFLVVALYTAFGAHMFVHLESTAEKERYLVKQYKAFDVNQTIEYTAQLLWFYGDEQEHNWTYEAYNRTVYKDLNRMEDFILGVVENNDYDGTRLGWIWDWTFMNALLLCMTILTTIGYGNIAPVTYEGQMFCIAYALFGCPIFLMFLANLGDSMAKGFTYIYSRCCCRSCRSKRYFSELPDNVSKRHARHVIDDVVGEEEYMPTSKLFVPITVNVVLLHLYFIIGGILFANWEHWEFTSAFYFTFVTLSTIGFGDYVPGNSLTDNPDSMTTTLKLLVSVIYIVLGMALLSMCINLMQEQIVEKCRWMSNEIGLSRNDEVAEAKPIDKRKDSLMPLMENSKGPSPFRSSNADIPPAGSNKPEDTAVLPGILAEN